MTKQRKIGNVLHCCHDFLKISKGAVSILLMIVTTPFLALTLFLIESVRYQDALELVFELEDLAANSTLGNYDTFLHDRFGLMAVDQSKSVSDRYNDYLTANSSLYSNEVQFDSVSVKGMFPLSDMEVFKQQVLENCEITSIVEILNESLDFDQLFEKLNGKIDTSKLEKLEENGGKIVKVLKAFKYIYFDIEGNPNPEGDDETKMDSLDTLWTKFKDTDMGEVDKKYKVFREKYINYCNELKTATENAKEGEDPNDATAVKNAKTALTTARNNYRDAIKTAQGSFKNVVKRIESLVGHIKDCKEMLEKEDAEEFGKYIDALNEVIKVVGEGMLTSDTLANDLTGDNDKYFEDFLGDLDNLYGTSFKTDVYTDADCDSLFDLGKKISKSLDNTVKLLKGCTSSLEKILKQDKDKSDLGKYLKVFSKLRELTLFYNSGMTAKINLDEMPVKNSPNLSEGELIKAISKFTDAADDIVSGLATFNLIKLIKAGIEIVEAIIHLVGCIIGFIGTIIEKIANICKDAQSYADAGKPGGFAVGALNAIYEDLLITGYACYNFSNRTNYKKVDKSTYYTGKSPLTGYSYQWKGNKDLAQSFAGDWQALKDISSGVNVTTDSTRFTAAELEYILCGLGSEVQNQVCAFINVYFLRMALDIPGVLNDEIIGNAAKTYPPFTLAIYLVALLIEPFLDTFILVNGGQVPLIKGTIYLSPKGIIQFIQDLDACCSVFSTTAEAGGTKKKDFDAALSELKNGETSSAGFKDGWLKQTYTEELMLVLLFRIPTDDKLQRMQNLVWMEARTKYLEDSKPFALEDSYTYVRADTDFTLKPMINAGFSDNGLIKAGNTRYLGY